MGRDRRGLFPGTFALRLDAQSYAGRTDSQRRQPRAQAPRPRGRPDGLGGVRSPLPPVGVGHDQPLDHVAPTTWTSSVWRLPSAGSGRPRLRPLARPAHRERRVRWLAETPAAPGGPHVRSGRAAGGCRWATSRAVYMAKQAAATESRGGRRRPVLRSGRSVDHSTYSK
jgi:hypothetical protein